MKSNSTSSTSNVNATKTSSFVGGSGGSRGGGKQQQQSLTQQLTGTVTAPAAATAAQAQRQPSSQPKLNAWSKPLQASSSKSATISPPPGLTGSTKSARSTSGTKPRPSSNVTSTDNNSNSVTLISNGTNGSSATSTINSSSSFAAELALRERFVHLVTVLTGQKVTATLKSGTVVTGILHTATPFAHLPLNQRHKYVLRAVTIDKQQENDSLSITPGQTLILDMSTVAQLHLKSIRMDQLVGNASSSSNGDAFVTDTEISKSSESKTGARELVSAGSAWTSGGNDILFSDTVLSGSSIGATKSYSRSSSNDDLPINSRAAKLAGISTISSNSSGTSKVVNSASTSSELKGSIAGWDQFKANEELFNVTGGYDETVYTTPLDKSTLEAEKILRAEKLAREIESTVTQNLHLAEERGQLAVQADYEDELDEEDRYSGVLSKNRVVTSLLLPATKSTTSVAGSQLSRTPPSLGGQQSGAATTPKVQQASSAQQARPKLNYAQAVAAAKQTSTAVTSAKTSAAPPGFATDNKSSAVKSTAVSVKKEAPAIEDSPKKDLQPLRTVESSVSKGASETKEPEKTETEHVTKEEPSKTEKVELVESLKEDSAKEVLPKEDVVKKVTKEANEAAVTEAEEEESKEKEDEEVSNSKPVSEESKQEDTAAAAAEASKSKLNANAKEFTLSFSAKPFIPPSTMPPPPPAQQQQQQPPPMPMMPQHMQQQHHQFQPQFFDPHTGLPIPMHAVPPYNAAAHMPHHGPMGTHHMMGAHMMAGQPHYPGQYPGMRAYPGQYGVDPHMMQQPQQTPPAIHQVPPPPPPPTANTTAPTTATTSTHTSGANTPVVSDDGGESPVQPTAVQDGSEQPAPPQQQQQQPQPQQMPVPTHMQWHQQQAAAAYYTPMHMNQQQQQQQAQQRMGPGGVYPPQQFMHHPQMAAMQPIRGPHQMYAPMGVGGVAPPPPPMRGYPGPGPYQPHNIGNVSGRGIDATSGYGGVDDEFVGGRGGRGGRGARGPGRGGRTGGRGRGRFGERGHGRGGRSRDDNQQPYQGGSQPGSGRQTPQSGPNPAESITGDQGAAAEGGNMTMDNENLATSITSLPQNNATASDTA